MLKWVGRKISSSLVVWHKKCYFFFTLTLFHCFYLPLSLTFPLAIFIDLHFYPSFSISLSGFLCLPSIFTSCNFTVSVHLLQQRIPRYCSKMWINYTLLTASFKYWEHVQRTVRAFQVKSGNNLIPPPFFFLFWYYLEP